MDIIIWDIIFFISNIIATDMWINLFEIFVIEKTYLTKKFWHYCNNEFFLVSPKAMLVEVLQPLLTNAIAMPEYSQFPRMYNMYIHTTIDTYKNVHLSNYCLSGAAPASLFLDMFDFFAPAAAHLPRYYIQIHVGWLKSFSVACKGFLSACAPKNGNLFVCMCR